MTAGKMARLVAASGVLGGVSLGLLGLASPIAAFGQSAPRLVRETAPGCSTVSAAVVKAAVGGAATAPSTGSGTSNGLKSINCTYSTVSISYSTPATVAEYNTQLAMLKKATTVKTVSGIGNDAFHGTGSSCSSSGCGTVQNLWFLVTGKAYVEVSPLKSTITVAQVEALGKKIATALK